MRFISKTLSAIDKIKLEIVFALYLTIRMPGLHLFCNACTVVVPIALAVVVIIEISGLASKS